MSRILPKSARLLLCRPEGGLTDILSRVGVCIRYAKAHQRTLIVQTDAKSSIHFRDDFGHYFVSSDSKLILTGKDFTTQFDRLQSIPSELTGLVNSYEITWSKDANNYVEAGSGRLLSFDFNKDYVETLLLYHGCGGDIEAAKVSLDWLSVSKSICDEVQRRVSKIDAAYTSIHIRNTDYKSDYQSRILALSDSIQGPIFLATDNYEVLDFCRSVFGSERVFNFTQFPEFAGFPIHSAKWMDSWRSNKDAICDLLMLALARHYIFFPLKSGQEGWPVYSGYSKLADVLHNDKALLQNFMSIG